MSSTQTSRTQARVAAKRDNIVNDLVDAIIDGKQLTSDQIARKRRVEVGTVRAIKANFTRGAYGTTKEMVKNRRKARNAS